MCSRLCLYNDISLLFSLTYLVFFIHEYFKAKCAIASALVSVRLELSTREELIEEMEEKGFRLKGSKTNTFLRNKNLFYAIMSHFGDSLSATLFQNVTDSRLRVEMMTSKYKEQQ